MTKEDITFAMTNDLDYELQDLIRRAQSSSLEHWNEIKADFTTRFLIDKIADLQYQVNELRRLYHN